jgi:hypothetical protein
MVDVTKLSKEEREFVTGIINRLDSGDVKKVGTELLAEFKRALTPEVFQKGYRLGDVLCQGDGAQAFNDVLTRENKSPLHLICAGYALSQEGKKSY